MLSPNILPTSHETLEFSDSNSVLVEWNSNNELLWDKKIATLNIDEAIDMIQTESPKDEFVAPSLTKKRKASDEEKRSNSFDSVLVFDKKQRSDSTDSEVTVNSLDLAEFESSLKFETGCFATQTGSISPSLVFHDANTLIENPSQKEDFGFSQSMFEGSKSMFNFSYHTYNDKETYNNDNNQAAEDNSQTIENSKVNTLNFEPAEHNSENSTLSISNDRSFDVSDNDEDDDNETITMFIKDFTSKVPGQQSLNIDHKMIKDPSRIKKFGDTTFYFTPFSWKHAMAKKVLDQEQEKKKHTNGSGALKNFPLVSNHGINCEHCQLVDTGEMFGPKMTHLQIKVCTANRYPMEVFEKALSKYNLVYGPNLTTARTYDPTWVYEFSPTRHGYLPSLSRYPKYPQTDTEWIDCYSYKFKEWVKTEMKLVKNRTGINGNPLNCKIINPSKEVMMKEINDALDDTTNIRDRKKSSNSKFVFIPPQKATLGSDIEVDVDEKECHCPYCPMDYKNPSKNFYHRKKSAYRGHIMNTHGVFDDGSLMKLPRKTISVYEYEERTKCWKNYPSGQCAICGLYIKFTNKNHGLLGYLRHMAGHKKNKHFKNMASPI